jgi:hypothetical protein
MMRSLACWFFVGVLIVSGCAREQITILVTAEGQWLNPLTGETKRAVIRPLVRIQPADETEPPKTLQSFGGLNWERWQASSDVTLTVIVRDVAKRLSGVEISFNERQQKFVPAQNRSGLKAVMTGTLLRNEIIATVFVREGEQVIPKWRLFIHPERRGQLVQFLFEVPATFGENPKLNLPEFLSNMLEVDDKGFFAEFNPKFLLQTGTTNQTIPVQSWRWINTIPPIPSRWLKTTSSVPLQIKPAQNLATDEDKSVWDEWGKQIKSFLLPSRQEKDRVFLSVFLEGKVIVRYEATASVLVEVRGEVGEDTDMGKARKQLEKALMSLAPITLSPPLRTLLRHHSGDTQKMYEQWVQQILRRNEALRNDLKQVAASLKLSNLSVRVLAEKVALEPKSIERQLRPIMVVLQLKLQGKARCDYHRQTHTMPISGKVRFALSTMSRHMPPILELRQRLWEDIPDKPIEVNVPIEGAEVQVPFAWLHPYLGVSMNVEVQAKGWRLTQPFSPSVGTVPPQRPSLFTLELEPTQAETAAFLLELPHDAQLSHATIVIQDNQNKIVASQQARWLEDYGGHGILLTELPYGIYRVAAEGNYIVNGKEQTFSLHKTVQVQSYHTVVWLSVQ